MVTYKQAGVNIDAGAELVRRLQRRCPDIGGFGGLFPFGDQYLVASTDGVGTKLKLAMAMDRHETIGIDCVAMCVNDVITTGARPLFFLDYFATSFLDVDQAEAVLKGIITGCEEAECVLLGGETAEMPGFYQQGEYDISGFAVGVVPKDQVIDGKSISKGDVLVGITSSGLHSNGFSLVRKIIEETGYPDFDLLCPTRIYVKKLLEIQQLISIKGVAHITGGGLTENVPRILPEGLGAVIKLDEIPSVFKWIKEAGKVSTHEMYRTFNMGIGLVIICSPNDAETVCRCHQDCRVIGEVINGQGVHYP